MPLRERPLRRDFTRQHRKQPQRAFIPFIQVFGTADTGASASGVNAANSLNTTWLRSAEAPLKMRIRGRRHPPGER